MSSIGATLMMGKGNTTPPPASAADDDEGVPERDESQRSTHSHRSKRMSSVPRQPRKKPGPKPGSATAKRLGQMGGVTTVAQHGSEHMRAIGKRGGDANKHAHLDDPDYFSRIGKRGAEARHRTKRTTQTEEGEKPSS